MSCYLCGCDETIPRQGGVKDNPDINVLECSNCGLVYLSSFPDDSSLHRSEANVEKWANDTISDDVRRAADFKGITSGKVVLDFGCGNGNFLKHVDAEYAIGVEIDDYARRYCQAWGLEVSPVIDSFMWYDVITMFHVIEHITEPTELLKDLGKHLAPHGKIVIETPNADDALLTLYDCRDFARFTYWSKHPFLYNESTLTALAIQSGFKVTRMEQYQRYPLSNHLYWLAYGKPNGHNEWSYLNNEEYVATLAKLKRCDTIIAELEVA
jgi:2-polyprenyl-3-methyl-5-hydroxy-6-metoxy-1,4-benzoquinol methylase